MAGQAITEASPSAARDTTTAAAYAFTLRASAVEPFLRVPHERPFHVGYSAVQLLMGDS